MINNFEELLLLKINVSRLDDTGLTNIKAETEDWYKSLDDGLLDKMSPIERIMRIILIDLEERLEAQFCVDKPILNVKSQYKIKNYRADFFVELFSCNGNKYIIECDGHDFHEKTKEQAKYDKQRERIFVQNGYKVLRYSGSEIYKDFESITQELFDIFSNEYAEAENE